MNEHNKLNLRRGNSMRLVELKEGISVAIPTKRVLGNIRILDVENDGSFTAHWTENWNVGGDFSSEVMRFDNNLVFDERDKKERNKFRKLNGLKEIK